MAEGGGLSGGEAPPVRATEFVLGVLAALGLEKICEGTFELWASEGDRLSGPWTIGVLAVAAVLVLTGVRFFHGNAMYLSREFRHWHHTEVQEGAWLSTPARHFKDVVFQFSQYVALLAAGLLVPRDATLRHTIVALMVLLISRIVWVGTCVLGAPKTETRSAQIAWFWSDLILLWALYLLPRILPQFTGVDWIALEYSALIFLAGLSDYAVNRHYYFSTDVAGGLVDQNQAGAHLVYMTALAGAPLPQKQAFTKDSMLRCLQPVFAVFMENPRTRKSLFLRGGAQLHVAVYVAKDGQLHPVFRYADKRVAKKLQNRTFPVGVGHVGNAFAKLMKSPDSAVVHSRPNPDLLLKAPDGSDDSVSKFYQSSVLANVFWPKNSTERDAIGILVVTSDQPDYFSKLQETLFIGLASVVSNRLVHMMQTPNLEEAREKMLGACKDPIVVETKAK